MGGPDHPRRSGRLPAPRERGRSSARFYEQAGLLPEPPRTGGGYRDYPATTADRLAFIRDAGQAPCEHVGELIEAHLAQVNARIAELISARSTLHALRQRAWETDPAGCSPDRVCTILASQQPT
ncbi:MerR family DNA-binding transcriptional regulator [Nonomuraea sp. NPDC050394]|uniref:MerR family DNA-binding transcriptional regulator n=1 Tax=Nonomuraea sp. NPDC050394 TaxID=3364363 RepID=UPI0037B08778